MKNKDTSHNLTIIDKDVGYTDNGESLNVYMKLLQKLPLLSKEEELRLARAISESKKEIINVLCHIPACVTEIYMVKERSVTEQRKLFFTMFDEEKEETSVAPFLEKLEKLITSLLKGKPKAVAKLAKFLNSMSFTLQDLQKFSAPANDYGTPEQIKTLENNLKAFQTAKNKMAEGNLKLVFSRAKLYLNRGLSLEDLIQEGNLGLMKAVEKFDAEKGYKFGTYATWWINQALGRAVADKARLIRVPVHMVENINKITKASAELNQALGREPTLEEISTHISLPVDKIKQAKRAANHPTSVEEPTGMVGIPLSEYLIDEDTPDPHQFVERRELAQRVRYLLSKLSPREEKIIRMRYGIGEKKTSFLSNIGKKLNISGECVRQLLGESLDELGRIDKRTEGLRINWRRSGKPEE